MGDLELGELGGACVATRVRCDVRCKAVFVNTGFVNWMITERLDQLVRINVSCKRHCVLMCVGAMANNIRS